MDELPSLPSPGQRLGRYELLQRLAVGGMAELYLARATSPGDFRKLVAIKRILPQHALDPQIMQMFLDEARLMAKLSHPNIPQVYDVGEKADVPYFVMEYVPGPDLRAVLAAAARRCAADTAAAAANGAAAAEQAPPHALPLAEALTIACGVAAGLHHAHEQRGDGGRPLGIVHRDVSPSNVLISPDGAVKLTDFGVAKWSEQRSFTEHGQLKGKLGHMSPEQCRGETLDRRSDVFALGTLLYEMVAGHPPFRADSEYELLSQIMSRDPEPPTRTDAPVPTELSEIILLALRRDRTERYSTAQALQLALESFAREQRLMVSPVALGRYLASLFGDEADAWRAVGAAPSPTAVTADAPTSLGPPPPERTATDLFGAAGAAAAGAVTVATAPPRRRWLMAAGAALALVLAIAAVTGWARRLESARATVPEPRASDGVSSSQPSGSTGDPAAGGLPRGPLIGEVRLPSTGLPVGPALPRAGTGTGTGAADIAGPAAAEPDETGARVQAPPRAARRPAGGARPRDRETAALLADPPSPEPERAPPAAASPPPPATATPSHTETGAATSAPVKVWDPDSPVPP
jgi:eukaryotic-like serine/threonine-protein kinase